MDSLETSDAEAAAVQKTANRVTLDSLRAKIAAEEIVNPMFAGHVTVVIAKLENGFVLIGKSAPADPANFDAELGLKLAREDVIRQMWPLEGYALRERLAGA
ncbi:MAG: hypothetical protein EOQ62_21655 [Mesorhizobium sp.]|uniref:Gp49 family protein n=1 Tax=Mesorhizobium sp. TaxID=1871066 RepID=UPI000FE8D488|nr:Gp49 family protein [Mesorhizobium sp.]RWG44142.1 MAG: hypothetical protein EOQ62_21655 [Mesorhizobium sp.]TIQ64440.1 MAG: hypothetical protein E5X41_17415 [Mesorhizobium sp.]